MRFKRLMETLMLPKALVPLNSKAFRTLPTPIMTKLDKSKKNKKSCGVKANIIKVPKASLCLHTSTCSLTAPS